MQITAGPACRCVLTCCYSLHGGGGQGMESKGAQRQINETRDGQRARQVFNTKSGRWHCVGCLWWPWPASPGVTFSCKCRWEADTQRSGIPAEELLRWWTPVRGPCWARALPASRGRVQPASCAVALWGHLRAECFHVDSVPLRSEVRHLGGWASPLIWEISPHRSGLGGALVYSDASSGLSGEEEVSRRERVWGVWVCVWERERDREGE